MFIAIRKYASTEHDDPTEDGYSRYMIGAVAHPMDVEALIRNEEWDTGVLSIELYKLHQEFTVKVEQVIEILGVQNHA